MAAPLPHLRADLDFMPSPAPDRPGLLIRDSFKYSDTMLIVPPPLVECLECFDGEHTELDLRAALVRITGDLQVGELQRSLIDALSGAGFLHDETFERMRDGRQRAFAQSRVREPAHAGTGYPDDPRDLRTTVKRYMDGAAAAGATANGLMGIAAPHVSPEGGWESYRAAYRLMTPQFQDRTFVVLGTSHYGEPDRFGLTRKPYATPWGETQPDLKLIDELARQPAAKMEDYCHAVEHSIEFQVVFLQWLYGPAIRILPVLCGSYARSIYGGGKPEDDSGVRGFLEALGEIAAREGDRLFWVLGIDMAHIGRRYGDSFSAIAGQGEMEAVGGRDRLRIERMAQGDADGFWNLVQENRDDLKWCGSSPVYTFLKAVPGARGALERYEQWNIDEQSVVSFAGMGFRKP